MSTASVALTTKEKTISETSAPGGRYKLTPSALAFYKASWFEHFPIVGGLIGVLLGRLFASRKAHVTIALSTLATVDAKPGRVWSMGNLVLTFKNGKQSQLPMEHVERFATAVRAQLTAR